MAGRVFEEGAGIAAARLRLEPTLVVLVHKRLQRSGVTRPQRHLGPEDSSISHEPARKSAAAVDEAEVRRLNYTLAGLVRQGHALEDVAKAAAVSAGVVDNGATYSPRDARRPLETSDAGERELAG